MTDTLAPETASDNDTSERRRGRKGLGYTLMTFEVRVHESHPATFKAIVDGIDAVIESSNPEGYYLRVGNRVNGDGSLDETVVKYWLDSPDSKTAAETITAPKLTASQKLVMRQDLERLGMSQEQIDAILADK
jgi:hypothetical protein